MRKDREVTSQIDFRLTIMNDKSDVIYLITKQVGIQRKRTEEMGTVDNARVIIGLR